MQSQNSGISVVLVSFNTRQLTLDCLQSLLADLSDFPNEVIVVDNASNDGSAAAVRTNFPIVDVIESTENVGFGAGNNIGFARCKYDYVLLLNTDTIVHPGAITAMKQILDNHGDCAAVGCKLVNADGTLQRSCWSFPSPTLAWSEALGLNRLGLTQDWYRWSHDSVACVDFVIGAALLVRKSVIDKLGGFDSRFFLYAEETDWQKRMHRAGWKVMFTPNGTITHFGGSSGANVRDRQLIESCRGTSKYVRKHHGLVGQELFRLAVILGSFSRWAYYSVRGIVDPTSRQKAAVLRKSLLWWSGLGTRAGIKEMRGTVAKSPS